MTGATVFKFVCLVTKSCLLVLVFLFLYGLMDEYAASVYEQDHCIFLQMASIQGHYSLCMLSMVLLLLADVDFRVRLCVARRGAPMAL